MMFSVLKTYGVHVVAGATRGVLGVWMMGRGRNEASGPPFFGFLTVS